MSILTKEIILKAQSGDDWNFGNHILYEMCGRFPGHKEKAQIIGKVWLIGRAYAAAIERRKTSDNEISEGDDFYFEQVAPIVLDSDIDIWIQSIEDIDLPDEKNVTRILEVHWRVTNLFFLISGLEKRSLSSKYLHFHGPKAFFIYDSRAAASISKFSSITGRVKKSDMLCDNEYRKFYMKCLRLQKYIVDEFGIYLPPRAIDNLLLS